MAFDPLHPNPKRFGSIGEHKATILKKVMGGGMIKVFTDPIGAAEKIEIELTDGKVVIIKDYEVTPNRAHFKKIDLYSNEDTLLDTIDIVSEDLQIHVFTFYFHKSPIGKGSGDIGLVIAESLIGGSVDPRYIAAAEVDPEVINTIQTVLKGKTI